MILNAFFLALGQMGDPRFRRVLILGVVLTIILLIGASAGVMQLVGWMAGEQTDVPLLGEVTWLNDLLSWSSLGVMMLLSVFLMIPVASAITSMFLDEVAAAVEERHYPHLPPANDIPFGDALIDTLNFLGVLILANIAGLVVYLICLVVFAPLAPVVFWSLNGFLLGREYITLAAMRRIGRDGAREMRKRHRGTIWLAGTLMAIPLTIPLVNLLVPIVGAATFTHIFHALNQRG